MQQNKLKKSIPATELFANTIYVVMVKYLKNMIGTRAIHVLKIFIDVLSDQINY